MTRSAPKNRHRPRAADLVAAILVMAFGMALVIVPPPNLDLWWLLAVGRRMVETHAFIYHDPFTFTVPGAAWSPQSWASALVYYALFKLAGMTAVSVLRVAMTGLIVVLVLRAQKRAGVSWAAASPVLVVALLTAHGRFADRGQLFEYVFLAWQLGFLLSSAGLAGRRFLLVPLAVQLAWVQFHSSFLLGPALAAIFWGGEWLAERLPGARAWGRHDYRRASILVLLLLAVCCINPNPRAFLLQPFDPAQHQLISRFTLEWKSPFDAAIAHADFHPWYELMLGAAGLAILMSLPSVPLAPALLMIATAVLSMQSHRFRAEFVLVAAVMVPLMLRESRLVARLCAGRVARKAWTIACVLVAAALVAGNVGRVGRKPVRDLTPSRALDFVRDNDIARRPFHPIGFGSYMMWYLYGERATFIDGRNFDAGVYRDFLRAQTGAPGLRAVVQKYRLDAFILPPPGRADAGMLSVHKSLLGWGDVWPLVYMGQDAFVYVARANADSTWLAHHAYAAYHPLTFVGRPRSAQEMAQVVADLERLTVESPGYARGWRALGMARFAGGQAAEAVGALRHALEIDPADAVAWNQLGEAAMTTGDFQEAVHAFTELTRLAPNHAPAHVSLSRALASAGNVEVAIDECQRAIGIEPGNAEARELLRALQGGR